jgi:hypothetical protein
VIWTTKELVFYSPWGQEIYLFSTASRPALGPTQSPILSILEPVCLEVNQLGLQASRFGRCVPGNESPLRFRYEDSQTPKPFCTLCSHGSNRLVWSGRVNFCWSSPAQSFLVSGPMTIFFLLTTLTESWHCSSDQLYLIYLFIAYLTTLSVARTWVVSAEWYKVSNG